MNRRELFKFLGAAAVAVGGGLIVGTEMPLPKKYFLPPATGWAASDTMPNVGDVITLWEGPPGPSKLFIVSSITNGRHRS